MPDARNMEIRKTRIALEAGERWDGWTISYEAPASERDAVLRELAAANQVGHFELHLDFEPGKMKEGAAAEKF